MGVSSEGGVNRPCVPTVWRDVCLKIYFNFAFSSLETKHSSVPSVNICLMKYRSYPPDRGADVAIVSNVAKIKHAWVLEYGAILQEKIRGAK